LASGLKKPRVIGGQTGVYRWNTWISTALVL
jgi:hypothetical protein